MQFRIGRRSCQAIDSKYREAAEVPRVYSENDPRCGRVAWSDVRQMPQSLGKRPSLELERQVARSNWLTMIKLEIEILGEILQVRDQYATWVWSQVYPGRVFRIQGMTFTYDELRGMGNGKHLVIPRKPLEKMAGGSNGSEKPAD
jgi:hypothetical protein